MLDIRITNWWNIILITFTFIGNIPQINSIKWENPISWFPQGPLQLGIWTLETPLRVCSFCPSPWSLLFLQWSQPSPLISIQAPAVAECGPLVKWCQIWVLVTSCGLGRLTKPLVKESWEVNLGPVLWAMERSVFTPFSFFLYKEINFYHVSNTCFLKHNIKMKLK